MWRGLCALSQRSLLRCLRSYGYCKRHGHGLRRVVSVAAPVDLEENDVECPERRCVASDLAHLDDLDSCSLLWQFERSGVLQHDQLFQTRLDSDVVELLDLSSLDDASSCFRVSRFEPLRALVDERLRIIKMVVVFGDLLGVPLCVGAVALYLVLLISVCVPSSGSCAVSCDLPPALLVDQEARSVIRRLPRMKRVRVWRCRSDDVRIDDRGTFLGPWGGKCLQTSVLACLCGAVQDRARRQFLKRCANHVGSGSILDDSRALRNLEVVVDVLQAERAFVWGWESARVG